MVAGSAHAFEEVRIAVARVKGPIHVRSSSPLDWRSASATSDPTQGPRVEVALSGDGLQIDGEAIADRSVRLWIRGRLPGASEDPLPVWDGPTLKLAGKTLRGAVEITRVGRALQVVNVVPLESYLAAVLGSEMPTSFPVEALKAQAVAARTYALQKKLANPDAPFHLGSTVLHQVYRGAEREHAKTRQAVAETLGEILTSGLAPIEAYFHASCGGKTESGKAALGRPLSYLQPVDCPCHTVPASRWTLEVTSAQLAAAVPGAEAGKLEILSRSSTGRALRLKVGPGQTLDAVTFRKKLGYREVKSLGFEISTQDEGHLALAGRGYGHGAGMCQWGAKVLADRGWDYGRILRHYYPGTELLRLY